MVIQNKEKNAKLTSKKNEDGVNSKDSGEQISQTSKPEQKNETLVINDQTQKETQPTSESEKVTKPVEEKTNNNKPNYFKYKKPISEFEEKVVDIARVTSVTKGGRRFSFAVMVVIGNHKSKVGWGYGKANEITSAIKKAINKAKKNLIVVPIFDKRTIPHQQNAKFLASKVMLKPAPKGKGIIASSSVRIVVELAGYLDIYTKSLGSRSKLNTVKATFAVLKKLRKVEEIAKLRDVSEKSLLENWG